MTLSTLKTLYRRDLGRLKNEISLYPSEDDLWKIKGNISNSGGNLCLHLVGNLKAYFGTVLGGTDYVRQRAIEFSAKDIPRQDLLHMIDETLEVVLSVLDQLTDEDLAKTYPENVFGEEMTTGFFIIHLAGHLGYHLGQINYHRRILGH